MENKELVSVIIPNYNRVSKLDDAVNSVLRQNYNKFEILIIDDSDKEIHMRLKDKYDANDKVEIFRGNPPNEVYAKDAYARNKGVRLADGKYIAFLDSDDTWREGKLCKHIDAFQAHPDIGLTWDMWIINGSGIKGSLDREIDSNQSSVMITTEKYKILSGDVLFNALWLRHNFIHMSAGIAKKSVIESVGGVPIQGYCDWALWLLISKECDVGFIDQVLTEKKIGEDSLDHNEHHQIKSRFNLLNTKLKMISHVKLFDYYDPSFVFNRILYLIRDYIKLFINTRIY